MGVISSTLIDKSGSSDSKYRRIYRATYRVVTSSASNGWLTVLSQSGLASPDPVPNLWSTYSLGGESDGSVYLQDKDANLESRESRTRWIVKVVWRPPEPGSDPEQDNQNNPLNRATRYHMEWANYSKVVEKDNLDKILTNAAMQQFDPPIEVDDDRPVLVAVRNEWPLASIIARALDYKNAVNTDTFYGATARQAKMESILSGEMLIENAIRFYSVVYRVQFNDKKWDIDPVNHGFNHFETAGDSETIVAVDKNKLPVGEPVGLNADGTRRADDAVPPKIFMSQVKLDDIRTPFRYYPERSFEAIGI